MSQDKEPFSWSARNARKLRLLDLFCGMGGWSIGFYREGFECTGIDIVDVGYPYEFLKADLSYTMPTMSHYDVVVASPPCTEFSSLTRLSYQKGQRGPPDPEKGVKLVKQAKHWIDEFQPRFWILENVYGSLEYLEPILGKPMVESKPWVLWGNLPYFMFDFEFNTGGDYKMSHTWQHRGAGNVLYLSPPKADKELEIKDFAFDPLRSWKRAKIPVWMSQQLARQCNEQISREIILRESQGGVKA
ncbi:MAG: DNA cytosine methyltransferase [Nitrososphaerota archaeon]|jgi:hypothetical protein|nr:DNA cytosine methyltransferase [Nitrososphaerota archaeon]